MAGQHRTRTTRPRRSVRALRAAVAGVLTVVAVPVVLATAAHADGTTLHVNFQPATTSAPSGYTADTGAAFNGTQGWEDSTGAPLNLTANTRVRGAAASPDKRYDTMILMQAGAGSGTTTPGQWAVVVPNGSYDVTVGVGDATATNSVNQINAQTGTANAVAIVNAFVPTSSTLFQTVTKRVTVTTGVLTLDATGGTNTKLDFVDVVAATADTLPPVPSISLSGPQSTTGSTTYTGTVTVTVSATDNVGVTGISYTVDGGATLPYTAPFTVSTLGQHTVGVSAVDAASNSGSTTSTFTITTPPPPPMPTSGHIDFGAQTSVPQSGYTLDYGQPFDATRGFGWEDNATGAAASLVGNGRDRNSTLSPDKRSDHLIQIQQVANTAGTTTVGQWEYSLTNGTYNVTVGVGDATATNSVNAITAERGTANQTTIINNFVPTATNLFQVVTKRVVVSDGRLTLDPTGGTNTKLDFVDIVTAGADTTAPTVSIALSGTVRTGGTAYAGPVTVTPTATDDTGVTATSFTVDNGSSQPYTAPFTVTGDGSHTVTVTASDAAGNVGSATQTFTIDTSAPPAPTSGHVDFGAQTSTPYPGYTLDYGQAFDATRGSGWEDNSTGTAASLVGNGRDRNSTLSPDKRYDHLIQIQQPANTVGTTTVGRWEYALANGSYSVTVGVGDSAATNSVDTITAERGTPNQTTIVNGFVPTATNLFSTQTKQITISDGRLTLDPTGGTNTKLDFVDIVPVADSTPPVASVTLAGVQDNTGAYIGNVIPTITAADEPGGSGLASTSYVLDTNAPVTITPASGATLPGVTADGNHTLTVTSTDVAGNVGKATVTWSEHHVAADTTKPTAAVTLAGSTLSNGVYTGTVTPTVTAADEPGGSGLATTSYTVDGGPAIAVTPAAGGPQTGITTDGTHTIVVTATDVAGNIGTATVTWVENHAAATDVTKPTVTATLSGTQNVGGTAYTSDVVPTLGASDELGGSGLASTSYVLDGSAPAPFTATGTTLPAVTTDGNHTLTVTATDVAGNVGSTVITWSEHHPSTDVTPPSVTAAISGPNIGGTYTGDVTATVAAADETGGSGLASLTYALDGAAPLPYTTPVVVKADGSHTFVATATDNAGNVATSTQSWTESHLTTAHVDFGPQGNAPFAGYVRDYGLPFDATRGYGWEDNSSGAASSLVGNGRVRGSSLSPDERYDTLIQIQQAANTSGVTTVGRWECAVANGTYNVTVAVGDTSAFNSVDTINAESGTANAVPIINGFVPSAATPFQTVTKRVVVTDGRLTLDPTGGTNTKLDYVDIVPTDVTPPVVQVNLAGTQNGGGIYTSYVTASVNATDETGGSGLVSTVYTLDGGAPTSYTGAIPVPLNGNHTLTVTATDAAGNVTTVTKTWTENHPDVTAPTISATLGGTLTNGSYVGNVTITVTAADEVGGSGLASTTYSLDGAAPVPYTAPVVVSAGGAHTFTATATDNASNTATTQRQSWSQTPDVTPPTVSVSNTGQKNGNGVYDDIVTVTITAADEAGGSGIASTTYSLDGGPTTAYTGPFVVSGDGTHTVTATATDNGGNVTPASTSFVISTVAPVTSGHIDFGAQTSTPYPGYTLDYGLPFDATVGSGWEDNATGLPASLVGNGRDRNSTLAPDKRYDHLIQIQEPSNTAGTTTVGRYEYTLANGTYNVTVGVGDSAATNSVDTITAERGTPNQVTIVNGFVPTSTTLFQTDTQLVTVSDGRLTLDPTGGSNTKLDFVDIVPTADTTPPTATIALAGPSNGNAYYGNVTATVTAADDAAGSGLASTTYVLDGAPAQPYTGPITVSTNGKHQLVVTATDKAGNVRTALASWTQQQDTTPPTAALTLGGTPNAAGTYGTVLVTITGTDETGGSGVGAITYSLDGAAMATYGGPFRVYTDGAHTITATVTDNAGNVSTPASASWTEAHTGTPQVSVTSADSTLLGLSVPRLVFSSAEDLAAADPRSFTFTNTTAVPVTVTGLAIGGTDAASFALAPGQPTTFVIPGNGTATVSVVFTPTPTTNCPDTTHPNLIANNTRDAVLTWSTDNLDSPPGSANLSGIYACYTGGNSEPVLDQIIHAAGYSTNVDSPNNDRRYIGPLRYLPGTDEVQSPYFTVANAALPVTYAPFAHYGLPPASGTYHPGGWNAKGSKTLNQMWIFPAVGPTGFNQVQRMMPTPNGTTTLKETTGTVFGLYMGDQAVYSDDSLNTALSSSGGAISPLHLIHGIRIFQAYDANRVLIPNTYLVANDVSLYPSGKNNDFQDIVAVLKNVTPALPVSPAPGAASLNRDLTTGVTVGANCAVTGFDGVLVNTAGTQCVAGKTTATSAGLGIVSTTGVLGSGTQQDAYYNSFDASTGAFTIRARVVGPLSTLTKKDQQIGVWFGPDSSNVVKVVVEHSGSGTDPHITEVSDQKGTSTTVSTLSLPALTTASTVDLIIHGNTQVPDATSTTNDPQAIHGYPLDQITVAYSINGATPVTLGTTVVSPADVSSWFSTSAKAGLTTSNTGTTTTVTGRFSQFQISKG